MATLQSPRKRLLIAQARLSAAVLAIGAMLVCEAPHDVPAPLDRTLVVAVLRAPAQWLTGARRASGFEDDLVTEYAAARGLAIRVVDVGSATELAAKVTTGEAHLGVGDSRITRHLLAGFDVALAAAPPLDLAWVVSPRLRTLGDDIDHFLAAARAKGVLSRLADRYLGARPEVDAREAAAFEERIDTLLPRYVDRFLEAERDTTVDWRVLAAVAYQESQWDPAATSPTGVRGFMQLTEDTAQALGIDRLDPTASIHGAARYLAALKARLPARIVEPDRTLLALAAYNIGAGHLEDARIVAQRLKLDPDRWDDVRQALPLLALPEHFEGARNGYARGGMPVAFVDRVRAYHDLLVRRDAFAVRAAR